MSKLITLQKAVSLLPEESMVFVGGSGLHRNPMAFCRELVRQRKRGLHLIGVIGGLAADMLAAGGVLGRVEMAAVVVEDSMDALYLRQGIFDGVIGAEFYSALAMSLRLYGGRIGVPFMLTRSMLATDLNAAGFRGENGKSSLVACPFSGEPVRLVPSINPDFSIIHAARADEDGNYELSGPVTTSDVSRSTSDGDLDGFEAGDVKIVTAEEVIKKLPKENVVKADYVIKTKYGAWPTTLGGNYDSNEENVEAWRDLSYKKYFTEWIKPAEKQLAQKIGRRVNSKDNNKK